MMRRRNILGVLGILALAVVTVHAEDFWVKKDWTKWSKDECNKMLQDSPWSKKWAKGEVMLSAALPSQQQRNPATDPKGTAGSGTIGQSSTGTNGAGQEGAAGDNALEIHYFIELQSALPIRQAIARRAQLNNNYDKMDADHKKAFDAQVQSLLEATYQDVIDVRVSYGSAQQVFERQLAEYWKSLPADGLPVDVFLINEKGDHIPPAKFISQRNADDSFELYFPRMQNNEPVIRDTDKSFSVQFPNPAVGSQKVGQNIPGDPNNPNRVGDTSNPASPTMGKERVLVTYQLNKMMVGGKPSY
jgi:hypothetical protein